MQTITTHYIDGAFVPSHGREVMDIVRPTDSQVITQVAMADEENTCLPAPDFPFSTAAKRTKKGRH